MLNFENTFKNVILTHRGTALKIVENIANT